MMKLLKLMMARKMAATPIGLAVLALGWLLGRKRRQRLQAQQQSGHGFWHHDKHRGRHHDKHGGRHDLLHHGGRKGPHRERVRIS
ncbi:DUF6203 family protein [Nonomuraea sp. NPDC002799]